MLVILYVNPRSFIWLSCKLTSLQVYKLTSCLLFFKDMFSCYFVSFVQVDELISLQVDELLVILYANPRSFIWLSCKLTSLQVYKYTSCLLFYKYMFSCYFVSFLQAAVLLSTLLTCHKQKTLARSQGFSGAYETRTRDLLRDRQAF